MESIIALIKGMGIFHLQWGQAVMIAVSLLLLWLAISRKFEPLLLLPIGFGGLLSNIPEAGRCRRCSTPHPCEAERPDRRWIDEWLSC